MKRIGVVALVLAAFVLCAGVFSVLLRVEGGPFASLRASSDTVRGEAATAEANLTAAQSTVRKSASAATAADTAVKAADEAVLAVREALAVIDAGAYDGEALHALYEAVIGAQDAFERSGNALSVIDAASRQPVDGAIQRVGEAAGIAEGMVLKDLRALTATAQTALKKASTAVSDAAALVFALSGALDAGAVLEDASYTPPEAAAGVAPPHAVADEAEALADEARWWQARATDVAAAAETAAGFAAEAVQSHSVGTRDAVIGFLTEYYILLLFTGLLLLAIGVICAFHGAWFLRQWKRNPVFSTFIALIVLLIVQTYSMRFTYPSIGAWFQFWLDNAFNVLRANTSVGMIALGMTLIILTGGIDLAVGSTLAGVGTVVMVLIDTSPRGLLVNLGITGIPAYIIGIAGGLLAGVAIGGLIGLIVTKGRVPPFIVTLGLMNIVRSVAQFLTKSYTPKVPSEFTAIANTVIFGQRLLPIVYWLAMAAIIYIVAKRTRFGRYVYAVGSNERTTRLSGINVDAVKFKAYALMGLLVAIASVTQVSRLGGMDIASSGNGYELDAIAAVVVGGASMSGGRGSVMGTVIGVLIIGVMNNLLILLGVDSFLTNAFKGAIVVAAVLMQRKQKEA